MTSTLQKPTIIFVLSVFCFALRVEFQLRKHEERINALEVVTKTQQTTSGHIFTGANRNYPGKLSIT